MSKKLLLPLTVGTAGLLGLFAGLFLLWPQLHCKSCFDYSPFASQRLQAYCRLPTKRIASDLFPIDAVVRMSGSNDPEVREYMASLLGAYDGNTAAFQALLVLANDPDESVRRAADDAIIQSVPQ